MANVRAGHADHTRANYSAADPTPAEAAARGWKDIGRAIYRNVSDHRILVLAAGSAFYAILSLSPTLAAAVSLYGLFADSRRIGALLDQLSGVLPGGMVDVVRDQLQRLIEHPRSTLGITLAVSLALSVWSANSGTKSLIDALNIVYGERERRGFIRLNLASLALTLGAIVLAVLAVAATVVVPLALAYVGFGGATDTLIAVGRWPLLLATITLALAVLYYFAPDREHPRWRWVTTGSVVASILWLVSSLLFSWYAANFAHYDKTYGSLAGIVALMVWLWLSTVVVLLGAELDAEMEEQAGERKSNDPREVGLPKRAKGH
ncbi:MAG: YihY/virulence factor BrkB family protein [Alphaproteobacteria bacterium]|nr:YihY/virulence factor BrkB family protein [Alphaproteobacteria bacterium]MBV8409093.1 YihY/virulence factor BrkB family protein [Alphaproteobacteria bacterium]